MVALGQVNMETLLSDGEIQGQLKDAGRTRDYEQEYEISEPTQGQLLIDAGRKSIKMDKFIELDPSLLIFLGLYAGDGDKVDSVGFGQKSIEIMHHANDELVEFFGDQFVIDYHITEDTLFFESDEMQKALEGMDTDKEGLERKKQYLVDEVEETLSERGMDVDRVTATVADTKGARSAGQSSREDLINLRGSGPFLPILLKLIEGVAQTLANDEESYPADTPWLEWNTTPSELAAYQIDIPEYVEESPRCQYYTSSGKLKQYKIEKVYREVTTLRKPYGQAFDVHTEAEIGPHFLYIAGLYMAEGGTPKEVLVSFFEKAWDKSLSIEFVSTEDEELDILIQAFNSVCEDFDDFLNYWKVKIGSQYMYETGNVAGKLGAPVLRRGEKGQGKARSFEIAEGIKQWAVATFPALEEIEPFFSHIELTGAGIPRWHVAFSSSPAVLLFALMNDLAFYQDTVSQYEVDSNA